MDPLQIAALAISLASRLAEAIQKYQIANTALEAMLAENRGPTDAEVEALRQAGANVDGRLAELFAPSGE